MKKFSELHIVCSDRKIFACPKVSITDLTNKEIEILDYVPNVKTSRGDLSYLIHYKDERGEGKFFTHSASIWEALDKINKEDFPFTTTIKSINCGSGKVFYELT